jgi:hypothetical protein
MNPILNLRNNTQVVASGFEIVDYAEVTILKLIQTAANCAAVICKGEYSPAFLSSESRPTGPDSATETVVPGWYGGIQRYNG